MSELSDSLIDDHAMPQAGDYVEFAIAPPDCEQYFHRNPETRRMQCLSLLRRILKSCIEPKQFKSVIFRPEITLAGGRIHLHGMVQLGDDPVLCIMQLNSMRYYTDDDERITRKQKISGEERRVAIYRIKNAKHKKERLDYITKDSKAWTEEIIKFDTLFDPHK